MDTVDLHSVTLSPIQVGLIVLALIAFFSSIALLIGYLINRKAKKENVFDLDDFLTNPNRRHQMIFCWSLNAILTKEQNLSPFVFGGYMGKHTKAINLRFRRNLKDWWGIKSPDDVWNIVSELANCEMHSSHFRETIVKSLSNPDVNLKLSGKDKKLVDIFSKDRERVMVLGLDAWDQIRAIGVIGLAYNAGYLSKEECYQPLIEIGIDLQKKYESFSELGRHYYYGHLFWTGSVLKSKIVERNVKWLLSTEKSPWVLFPYNYKLGTQITSSLSQ